MGFVHRRNTKKREKMVNGRKTENELLIVFVKFISWIRNLFVRGRMLSNFFPPSVRDFPFLFAVIFPRPENGEKSEEKQKFLAKKKTQENVWARGESSTVDISAGLLHKKMQRTATIMPKKPFWIWIECVYLIIFLKCFPKSFFVLASWLPSLRAILIAWKRQKWRKEENERKTSNVFEWIRRIQLEEREKVFKRVLKTIDIDTAYTRRTKWNIQSLKVAILFLRSQVNGFSD